MRSPLVALRDASGSWTFWVLFGTFFVCGLSTNGLIQTHWITLCGDFGMAPVAAAGMLALIGVFDLGGTIMSGWLSDRYDNRWLLFWYYGLRGLSLLYLPFSGFTLLRPVALRRVLWPGLDRDRAADGADDRRALRARARQPGLRLDLHRAPARRRHRRIRRRRHA